MSIITTSSLSAQTDTEDNSGTIEYSEDTIIVTGRLPIAESEAAAYKRQKNADQLINVVASDAIGRLPDQNVASALSRLPGVSVERDQGQERYVNLRGAPNKWTTISFNGLNVVSPEGRQSRFDTIPNAIVSSIEAVKAITADMPAESIAGNINIITRDPFDYNRLRVSGELAGGYLELGDGPQYNVAGTISNTFRDNTIGVLVSGSFYKREQITDNIEGRFERAAEAAGTAGEDLIWSRQSDYRVYHLERANKGVTGRIDWRPVDEHRLFVSSIFTEFTDDEVRDRYIFDFDSNTPNNCYAQVGPPCNNTPVAGTVFGARIDATFNTNLYRENILTNTVGGDHALSEWDIGWRLGFTHTVDELIAPARYNFVSPDDPTLRPTVAYDYTDSDFPTSFLLETVPVGDGTFTAGAPIDVLGPQHFQLNRIQFFDEVDRTQAYLAKVNMSRELDVGGVPVQVKTGLSYDRRIKKGDRSETIINQASLNAAGLDIPVIGDILTDNEWDGTFPIQFIVPLFSSETAVGLHNDLANAGGSIIPAGVQERNFFRVQEDIIAGYISATADHDWGNVIYGVRAEYSEHEGTALAQIGSGPFTPVESGESRVDFFPSVHVNYDIDEDRKVRLSFNSGLARPDFDELAPNFLIDDDASNGTVIGGNPDAKPEKTYGVDLYYEHYLEPLGIFSVGGFYKTIQDPLVQVSTTFGRTDFDEPGFTRSDYLFETVGNGEDGHYAGLEIAYAQQFDFLPEWGLPDWSEGFGVNANVTLVDSEIELDDGRKVPLFGASDLTYNTSGYWEYENVSMRLNWQWRTRWLDAVGSDEDLDRYWAQLGRLSFGARYQVNDRYEWFFDANNLTDQVGRRINGNSGRVFEIEGFGPRYLTGIRFTY
ncbi:MAG: TonB-dependent receptor [Aquisalinus sp.]|nr:TonB-dependent receptor [Aquisalinus sp.]